VKHYNIQTSPWAGLKYFLISASAC